MSKTVIRTGPWSAFWDDAKTEPQPFNMNVPAGPPQTTVDEKYIPGTPTKVYPYSMLIQKPKAPAAAAPARAAPKVSQAPQPAKPSPSPQNTATGDSSLKVVPAGKADQTTVVVSAEPADCEVSVNGLLVGTTPVRLKLPEGVHVIEVAKEGYQPARKELQVYAGSDSVLKIKLEPK